LANIPANANWNLIKQLLLDNKGEIAMGDNYDNFIKWFKEPVRDLYKNHDAGFIILMGSLPLLERYLRQKSGLFERWKLNGEFFDAFRDIFPQVKSRKSAERFWRIYRNGLLHQATLSLKTEKGEIKILEASVHNDAQEIEADGQVFKVSPIKFSKKVIQTIESDFATFEGASSPNHPPAKIFPSTGYSGWEMD
jgi:lipoate-protein ligase A